MGHCQSGSITQTGHEAAAAALTVLITSSISILESDAIDDREEADLF
jgi:hypothetical protein